MESEATGESNNKSKSKSSSSSPNLDSGSISAVPWLDLPDPITEHILERLDVCAYLRFAAVCRHWGSIQATHRRRHAPHPPKMVNLPWLGHSLRGDDSLSCLVPFPDDEQRQIRLRTPLLPGFLKSMAVVDGAQSIDVLSFAASPNGWLMFGTHSDGYWHTSIFNPVSGVQVPFPPISNRGVFLIRALALSPPPNCAILFDVMFDFRDIYLRLARGAEVHDVPFSNYGDTHRPFHAISAIFWRDRFYCFSLSKGLVVVDPMPSEPTAYFLEMDQSQLPDPWSVSNHKFNMENFLLESNGDILLVIESFKCDLYGSILGLVGCQVFCADLIKKRWTRVTDIGDRVIVIFNKLAISLMAVDIGLRENCIYCIDHCKKEPRPWSVFDLETKSLTDASLTYPPPSFGHFMFLPAIN